MQRPLFCEWGLVKIFKDSNEIQNSIQANQTLTLEHILLGQMQHIWSRILEIDSGVFESSKHFQF